MIRRKLYELQKYVEIELFNLSPTKKPFDRARKTKESTPAQKNLNDKKSRNYLRRVVHANFKPGDYAAHLTFDDDHLPKTEKDALRLVNNFIRKLRRLWNKKCPGVPFKYVYIFSEVDGDTGEIVRKHFHLIISGGLSRDEIEDKWRNGFANVDKLQFTEEGIEKLINYMHKQACGKRRWKGSNTLIKPEPKVSDKAVTRSEIEKIRKNPDDTELIEKIINKGRTKNRLILTRCDITYDGRELFGSDADPGEGMGIAILIRARLEDWNR